MGSPLCLPRYALTLAVVVFSGYRSLRRPMGLVLDLVDGGRRGIQVEQNGPYSLEQYG